MTSVAPLQLIELGLDPAQFKKATTDEYHGPCPRCGGEDRFRVHTDHQYPDWNFECRQCHFKGWARDLNAALKMPVSEADRKLWAETKRKQDAARASEIKARLSDITNAELWAEMNRRMADEQRLQWLTWGIPTDWQNYLQLGYTQHYSQSIPTPAYTIPYFHNTTEGKQFATLQYRLVDAPNPADRYRFTVGLPATFYETTPSEPISNVAIICEGAKKAMNLKINTKVGDSSVLSVPSKSAWGGVEGAVKDCERVYILLDPDGLKQAHELGQRIGSKARIVELPSKIDDLILGNQITQAELRTAFKWAVRP